MGNHYYKNYRRYGNAGKKRDRGFLLFCCAVLVPLFAFVMFAEDKGDIKNAFASGKDSVVGVFSNAVAYGKDLLGLEKTSFTLPVSSGVVVEEFGVVTDAEGKEAYHKGIDIQVPAGSEALSAADGTVADISKHDDGSLWVTVTHPQHWSTVYGRLGEAYVAVGDEVKKGTPLGVPVGEILHFEVLEDEKEKDPVGYFEKGTDG